MRHSGWTWFQMVSRMGLVVIALVAAASFGIHARWLLMVLCMVCGVGGGYDLLEWAHETDKELQRGLHRRTNHQ